MSYEKNKNRFKKWILPVVGFGLLVCYVWVTINRHNERVVQEYAQKVRMMQWEYERAPEVCQPGLALVIALHPNEYSSEFLEDDLQDFLIHIRSLVENVGSE